MLPHMYILDINDVMFFLTILHHPNDGFVIKSFIKFCTGHTRLASRKKLLQTMISPVQTPILTGFDAFALEPIINYQDN